MSRGKIRSSVLVQIFYSDQRVTQEKLHKTDQNAKYNFICNLFFVFYTKLGFIAQFGYAILAKLCNHKKDQLHVLFKYVISSIWYT